MKKYITGAVVATACASMAFSLVLCSSSPTKGSATYLEVSTPETPASFTLCGKNIDLDRADMWERFDREITAMLYTHGNTMLTIKRANKYFPVMAPILEANGVPSDLLYLACIESYLNPRAVSPAKAAGIWQFMPATAKQYGLEVSDEVDERYNLEKATKAACKYLKASQRKHGNWESAMAAYNGGDGRIGRELEAQGQSSSLDLYLTDETSRYVFRIMAMKEIMEHAPAYGFRLKADQLYQPVECDVVEVSGPVASWAEWAAKHGITYAQLREENPWIRAKSLTNKAGKTYKVRVPKKGALSRSKQKKTVYDRSWIVD